MSVDVENLFFDQHRKQQALTFEDLELNEDGSPRERLEETAGSGPVDKSRKGSVDERILTLIQMINRSNDMYTSSSCSGRAILFTHHNDEPVNSDLLAKSQKKGCKWIFVTHDEVIPSVFKEAWKDVPLNVEVTFKVEACILHIQCRKLVDAKKLIHVATESGFRNSGMVISGKNKITVAVRSALSMEVPLMKNSGVPPESLDGFIEYMLQKANEKLQENWIRTEKLTTIFQKYFPIL